MNHDAQYYIAKMPATEYMISASPFLLYFSYALTLVVILSNVSLYKLQ